MASHVTTLTCAKDARYNGLNKTTDYSSSELRVYGNHSNQKYASILGFDISSIGLNKVVTRLTLKIKINDLYNIGYGDSLYDVLADYNNQVNFFNQYPFVIKARRLNSYLLSEIETTLDANDILAKNDSDNLFSTISLGTDTSKNISMITGTISMGIDDISNINNSEVIVGLLGDYNFRNDATSSSYAKISSRTGSYPPTLTVYYDDYVPQAPINLKPDATIRNKSGEINLTWEFNTDVAIQNLAEVVYSTDGFATSNTKLVSGNKNNYTIPANTFTAGQTVQWKVRVTDTNGDITDYSNAATITIGATPPSTPEPISPVNTIVNSSDIIYYRWKFVDVYGYIQGGFDIEYAKVGEIETTVHINSAVAQFAMPKATLQGGNYRWRVRCYNQFGELGAYSEWQPIYSIGKPKGPTVTSITNNCRPTVTWTSLEQDLFQIRILKNGIEIYSSGEQASGDYKTFQVLQYLKNGSYTLSIKITNIYSLWSDETTYNFVVNTVQPAKPTFAIGPGEFNTSLIIESQTITNIIYRKGKKETEFTLVTELNQNSYNDYMVAAGENQYFVRAISEESFSDSDIKSAVIEFKGIIIGNEDNPANLINMWKTFGSDKRKSVGIERDSYKIKCEGRKYPISQRTEFRNYTESHEYFLKDEEYEKFESFIIESNIVYYRNSHGISFYAELNNVVTQENTFGYVISFTITRLDRK